MAPLSNVLKPLAMALALATAPLSMATPSRQPRYAYYGCVAAPSSAFPHIISNPSAAHLSPAQCQAACSSWGRFAAMGSDQCRCSSPTTTTDSPVDYIILDDSQCTKACVKEDGESSVCGGPARSGLWTVYIRDHVDQGAELRRREEKEEEEEGPSKSSTATTTRTLVPSITAIPEGVNTSEITAALVTAPSTVPLRPASTLLFVTVPASSEVTETAAPAAEDGSAESSSSGVGRVAIGGGGAVVGLVCGGVIAAMLL